MNYVRNYGDVVSNCNKSRLKSKGLQTLAIVILILLLAGMFAFGQAFFAQGVPFYSQQIAEVAPVDLATVQEVLEGSNEALAEIAADDSFALANAEDEAFLNGEEVSNEAEDVALQEEETEDEFTISPVAIVPTTDVIAFLDPVPPGAVGVGSIAALNTAITNANAGTGNPYIYFTQNIAAGATVANVVTATGVTIDGRGHVWSSSSNNSSLRVNSGAGTERIFTVKNIDFDVAGRGSTLITNQAMISFNGANCNAIQANSRWWTINIHNVRAVNNASDARAPAFNMNMGLVSLSSGTVNLSGENNWGSGQRRALINAREVNFTGGTTELRLTGSRTLANSRDGLTSAIRATPHSDHQALGARVTLSGGAEVNIDRRLTGTLRAGYAIRIHTGGLSAQNVRPAELILDEASSLTVLGNTLTRTNAAADNAGLVSLRGGSGGFTVLGGSTLTVRNGDAGQRVGSAIFQQIQGGVSVIEGQGSQVDIFQGGSNVGRGAALRFYMSGGASNQTFRVVDGGRLDIERARSTGTTNASRGAALRFGQGTGNRFYVNNGTVVIRHAGNGDTNGRNPGTARTLCFNAAVSFTANNWAFISVGDSDIYLHSERGAAVNARGQRDGRIDVGPGANLIMQGRTPGTGAADAIVRSTGGNVHFHMDNPQFYDFVNTRPGGGRIFALGTAAGNTFTSVNSDISVWRRGVNVWHGEPDRAWTLIDVRLSGAQLRTVAATSYPDFIAYYNTSPHSRRMEMYTRISGNNSRPIIEEALDLTNADRHVRALAITPEGRIRDPRPVWTDELWGTFTRTCAQTGTQTTISSLDAPTGSRVRSYYTETMYEAQTNVRTEDGVLKMTYDSDDRTRFLNAGDIYQVDSAWRSIPNADLPRNHMAANLPPAFVFAPVRDVMPPEPVVPDEMVVPHTQVNFAGSWSISTTEFDDGPLMGSDGIRVYARNSDPASAAGMALRNITGSGFVTPDNRWTFTADPDQLFAGDMVWVSLADTQNPANWNPVVPTPYRDRIIPEAGWFIVAPLGTMPITAQYFYNDIEYIDYRYLNFSLTIPDTGEQRWANKGPGTNSPTTVYFPARDRIGYMVDRIEVRGPGGTVVSYLTQANGGLDASGRPTAPLEMIPGATTIHIRYVHDPEFRRDIALQFRFADFGGTAAQSWVLQPSTLYTAVRTGSYNQTGVNRFPDMGLGDFHITQTLTEAQVLALINALFAEEVDPNTGDPIPAVIDGLPRGFVPCPYNHIQLPVQGAGAGTQLTFPVRMADLYDAQTTGAGRPIIINFVATLEDIAIEQVVQRCEDGGADSLGTQAQRNVFDNMSFSHQVHLSRAPVGGRNPNLANAGVEGWQNHRLEVEIESYRFGTGSADDREYPPLVYTTHTWQAAADSLDRGRIRIGTWDNSTAGTNDAGTGANITNAAAANRRVNADEIITIRNVPSTAYIQIGQQIHAAPAGTHDTNPAHSSWLNDAIRNRHERDFLCSNTEQRYLWPLVPLRHNAWTGSPLSEGNNPHHTTNWASPFGVASTPNHAPGRPMDNTSKDYEFRVIPRRSFELVVNNEVSGDAADMNRARYFNIQFRDEQGNYLLEGRQLMLYRGEYEMVQITCPDTSELIYVQSPLMHPVTVGANGTIQSSLLRLMPGDYFSLQRLGGMYTASVRMLSFAGADDYLVSHYYSRDEAGFQSDSSLGMTTAHISFDRDTLRVTFESYQEDNLPIPTGLIIGGTGVLTTLFVAGGTVAALIARRKRKEIESLALL